MRKSWENNGQIYAVKCFCGNRRGDRLTPWLVFTSPTLPAARVCLGACSEGEPGHWKPSTRPRALRLNMIYQAHRKAGSPRSSCAVIAAGAGGVPLVSDSVIDWL